MIGVIKKAHKNNILNVNGLAIMDKPVTTQQLGMDLLLVVILQNMGRIIFCNGANNYFQTHILALQPTEMSSQKSI